LSEIEATENLKAVTYKNMTPPRAKYPDAASGDFKKTLPMMRASKI
jgi:hypothetical protein